MIKHSLVVLFFACINFCQSQNLLGKWISVDDETGKEKSVVEIYKNNGKIYGKIVELLNNDEENPICEECTGDKKDQPVIGMVIIDGLTKNDAVYDDGTILNPENGKLYKCRLKLTENPNELQVRGYIAFFYKTQYWKRMK